MRSTPASVSRSGRQARSLARTTSATDPPMRSHHRSRSAAVSIGYGRSHRRGRARLLAVAHDEAAADRVPRGLAGRAAGGGGGERQGIGMKRQRAVDMKHDAARWLKRHRRRASERQRTGPRNARDTRVEIGKIAGDRIEPEQAGLHRQVRAVPPPGLGQRPEQVHAKRRDIACAPRQASRSARKASAARQGPSVCELDGPTPILNMSKTERGSDTGDSSR